MKKILVLISCILITSCHDNNLDMPDSFFKDVESKAFQPSQNIKIVDGILSFENRIAVDITLSELADANRDAIYLWEKEIGIRTPASIFYNVIVAEDSINKYFINLPKSEQEYWKKQSPVHSEIYFEALSSGNIKLIPDGEGGEYFDLNLYDNSYAALLNEDGFIIVDDVIYQYKGNALKIIFDGDVQKIKSIKKINRDFVSEDFLVEIKKESNLKSITIDWSYNWSKDMTDIGYSEWYSFDPNWLGRDQKRIKVWIDGHSEPYGTYSDYCAQYVNCTFIIRAEAQIRNFWGNWVYGSYMPSFSFSADWDYFYKDYSNDPYITVGCGLYETTKSSVPDYSCTSNPSVNCPKPPYSKNIPSANNSYTHLTPHGAWSSYPKFFSDVFTVSGSVTWSYGPLSNKTYNF